jgi:hypothetical protein
MSTQPAPTYNPEPFNPVIYEQLKGDQGDIDFIDNATLENCNINDSTLTNCVFVGPIYSGPIKSKTYTIENDSGLDSAALTSVGNATNNVDLNFLPGVGSTNSTAFTIKNNSVVQHTFDLSGNATHTGNLILNGNNKSLQLNSTGGIYCGGAATTVSQQEISYLTGTTSNIQTQINNINAGAIKSQNNIWSGTNQYDNTTLFNNNSTWNAADLYLTNDATLQQSNSTTANNLGTTIIKTSYGQSNVTTLNIGDTVSGNVLRLMPNIPAGSFNPASDSGNQTMFAYGTQNTETLELSTWSTTHSAVKIKPTSVQIGAGGTANTPTSSVICDGSNVVISPSIKYPNNTIQNSAFTGGPAGSYTNSNITLDSNGKISAISSGTNLIVANNSWAGTNAFDTSLPTSTLTPSSNNQLTTKAYVDSAVSGGGSGLLNTPNDWKGTNTFENTVETETNTYLATATGNVGIGTTSPGYKLDVNGNSRITGNLETTGYIRPSAGNGNNGIMFPNDPGGGSGDTAYLKYYVTSGENCTLELGVTNDSTDLIYINGSQTTKNLTCNDSSGNPYNNYVNATVHYGTRFQVNPSGSTNYLSSIENRFNSNGCHTFFNYSTSNVLLDSSTYVLPKMIKIATPIGGSTYLGNLKSILFQVKAGWWTTTNRYETSFKLIIWPSRLWNNTTVATKWNLNNKIDNNSNYQYTNSSWAPNGRWYCTYDQKFSDLGGPQQGWLIPYGYNRVFICFSGASGSQTDNNFHCNITCLDATDSTANNIGWEMTSTDVGNWS